MYIDGEKGPKCGCGYDTYISFYEGEPYLICIFHTSEEGVMWKIIKEKPENWPNLSIEETFDILMKDET